MLDAIKIIAAVAVASRIIELVAPESNLKKQLSVVAGLVFLAALVKTILSLFGR